MNIVKTNVALTAFQTGDVGSVEPCSIGQFFLGQALRLPDRAHPLAEGLAVRRMRSLPSAVRHDDVEP
jgi:hypothetical protein